MQKSNRIGTAGNTRSKTARNTRDMIIALREQPDPEHHPACYLYTMERSAKAQIILYAQFSLSRVGSRHARNIISQVLAKTSDEDTKQQLQYVLECIDSLLETWYTTVVDLVTAQLLCRYLVPPVADARGNTVHTFIDRELSQTTATPGMLPILATAFV